MTFSKVICDHNTLFPPEEITPSLLRRWNDALGDRICWFVHRGSHDSSYGLLETLTQSRILGTAQDNIYLHTHLSISGAQRCTTPHGNIDSRPTISNRHRHFHLQRVAQKQAHVQRLKWQLCSLSQVWAASAEFCSLTRSFNIYAKLPRVGGQRMRGLPSTWRTEMLRHRMESANGKQ